MNDWNTTKRMLPARAGALAVALVAALALAPGCTPEQDEALESELGESPGEGIADRPLEGSADRPGEGSAEEPSAAGMAERQEIEMISRDGEVLGTAMVEDENGGMAVTVDLDGLEPGVRGLHLHETGRCEPPDFESAGGHFDMNDRQHGFDNPAGPHDGDLPNLVVEDDGMARVRVFNARATLADLRDGDGTALVLHAERDDYRTDPAGDAGERIACGVIFPG